jgi:hypothetical protein
MVLRGRHAFSAELTVTRVLHRTDPLGIACP